MLLVQTRLGPSAIHGVGVFSEESISKGQVVWEWHEGIDQRVSANAMDLLPPVCQDYLKRYGWVEGGQHVIGMDSERFINHASDPNCVISPDGSQVIALRDIDPGEELTQNYATFDEAWGDPAHGYDWSEETA